MVNMSTLRQHNMTLKYNMSQLKKGMENSIKLAGPDVSLTYLDERNDVVPIPASSIDGSRLLAIKSHQKKLTKREVTFMRETAASFDLKTSFSEMVGVEIGYSHDEWRIANRLEKRGFGISLPDFHGEKDSSFILSELGVMWIAINAPHVTNSYLGELHNV